MKLDNTKIIAAIQEAESHTSGEIRVHLTNFLVGNVYKRATRQFEKLGMTKTAKRNGILIYISQIPHNFAIIGDAGIHAKVGQEFWDDIRDTLLIYFKKGEFTDGVCAAIKECGKQLKNYFPFEAGDVNELPNDLSRD